jgi:hypothetical protein
MTRRQARTWCEIAHGLSRDLVSISPGNSYTICVCSSGPCMDHSGLFLRGLFTPFSQYVERKKPGLLTWDSDRNCYFCILHRGDELFHLYTDEFRVPFNNWIRNRAERLGPRVSVPFEELNDQDLFLVNLPDLKFRKEYHVPKRTWSWAQTVQAARSGLVEPRPYPILKSDRPPENLTGGLGPQKRA